MEPAGQDLGAPSAPGIDDTTAPIAAECQSFLDNVTAQCGPAWAWNDQADRRAAGAFFRPMRSAIASSTDFLSVGATRGRGRASACMTAAQRRALPARTPYRSAARFG